MPTDNVPTTPASSSAASSVGKPTFSGRIPRLVDGSVVALGPAPPAPTQNRQWIAGQSGYSQRPEKDTEPCCDITSIRFTPSTPRTVQILLRKMLGEDPDISDQPSSAFLTPHNFDPVSSDEITNDPLHLAPGARENDDRNSNFISVAEFASVATSTPTVFHSIPKKPILPFVLLSRPLGSYARWEIPPIELAHDFINDTICKMFSDDVNGAQTFHRVRSWGLTSIVFLFSSDKDMMNNFRRCVAAWSYQEVEFDTYPKDVLTASAQLTILLKSSMKAFQAQMIPKILFHRNKETLAGVLRVVATRRFKPNERSSRGELKDNWRNIDLVGDAQFLRCLQALPESRPFLLGVEPVQMHGGLRPFEPSILDGKRPRDPSSSARSISSSSSSATLMPDPPSSDLAFSSDSSGHPQPSFDRPKRGRGAPHARASRRGRQARKPRI